MADVPPIDRPGVGADLSLAPEAINLQTNLAFAMAGLTQNVV